MTVELSAEDEARVVAAIADAERGNSGEVRVHLVRAGQAEPLLDARRWFFELGMQHTAADTGVLLYVAVGDRTAAIFAGGALHSTVPPSRWQAVIDAVTAGYGAGRPGDGLCDGLNRVGGILREVLPGDDAAGNELPDVVTTA